MAMPAATVMFPKPPLPFMMLAVWDGAAGSVMSIIRMPSPMAAATYVRPDICTVSTCMGPDISPAYSPNMEEVADGAAGWVTSIT